MVLGLITEYNPFHNGHLYHLNKSKSITKADYTIAIMSGNFVQRGEPAIFDKYIRTKAALLNGVDLVIELPIYYATSSAEYFAKCSVKTLAKTNIIDKIVFGSESGNIDFLNKVADILHYESAEFKGSLRNALSEGNSFPKSISIAVNSIIGNNIETINTPNNILAVEYLKNLKKINSKIEMLTIKRFKSHYNSNLVNSGFASASAARNMIKNKNYSELSEIIPSNALEIFLEKENFFPNNLDNFSMIFNYLLRQKSKNELKEILDISEGLENRLISAAEKNFLISDIIKESKTKRYTYTKLQRAILHIILDIKKKDFNRLEINGAAPYIRVLGFRKSSEKLLRELCKNSEIPVITNLKNAENILDKHDFLCLKKEIDSTDLYYLALKRPLRKNFEYSMPMIIV